MVTGFEQLAVSLIKGADPDVCAQHSFDDYHARGVLYLNLLRAPDLTCKLYVVDPVESREWLVAPHDHAYAFHSTVLAGEMRHGLFARGYGGTRHEFEVDSKAHAFRPRGKARLYNVSTDVLRRGETYYLPSDRIHTIGVSRPAVLFLCQYRREKTATSLYSEEPPPPNVDGLYRPVSPEMFAAKIGHVRRILGVES